MQEVSDVDDCLDNQVDVLSERAKKSKPIEELCVHGDESNTSHESDPVQVDDAVISLVLIITQALQSADYHRDEGDQVGEDADKV